MLASCVELKKGREWGRGGGGGRRGGGRGGRGLGGGSGPHSVPSETECLCMVPHGESMSCPLVCVVWCIELVLHVHVCITAFSVIYMYNVYMCAH